ncbi:TolC family protein [Geofilum rubicundum]|uniref:Outer membrane protein TolC n=1 Tax=Geofilum rubicundum JCM 15548 TaxID=1236989 RepID=A0A0E9LX81_9BACT|nr:TolC family protein [Geofilum rubicundum]GAO29893.1 outer membrane protein TolC [Geofilum rubicundum JCM 15548]
MMKPIIKKSFALILIFLLGIKILDAQSGSIVLSLDDALKLAQEQSYHAKVNQHQQLTGYWNYQNFLADFRPSLSLRTSPLTYQNNKRYTGIEDSYYRNESLQSEALLYLDQRISPLGGTLSVSSGLQRYEFLASESSPEYFSQPFIINYRQSLLGFNPMKWARKIEPLIFETTKREYVEDTEALNLSVVSYFFDYTWLGWNVKLAKENLDDAQALIEVAEQRYESGSLSRDELLDMQLANSNAFRFYKELVLQQRKAKDDFLNLLMLPTNIEIETILPETLPLEQVDVKKVFELANANNPELLRKELDLLINQRNLEQAKRERYFQANIDLAYNRTKSAPATQFSDVYKPEFNTSSYISLGLNVPILDWGRGKGRYEVARSSLETSELLANKTIQQIEQDALTFGITFNSQKIIIESAARSNSLATESYALTVDRFHEGNADVLKLTSTRRAKDKARLDYINTLERYWTYYFLLRQLTLFDFNNGTSLFIE